MTHKQQQEWNTMKKAIGGLMAHVDLLTKDLEEMAHRLNEQAERIAQFEADRAPALTEKTV